MEIQRIQNSQNNVEKEVRGVTLLDVKTYYKATIQQIVVVRIDI